MQISSDKLLRKKSKPDRLIFI